jgi:general secretion pathway protein B
MIAGASAVPPGPPAVTRTTPGRGSVVYESLPDSAMVGGAPYVPPAASAQGAQAPRTPSNPGSSLPPADELAGAGVPPLNLDLHVYTANAAERMVFINSHKYREGDTLQEGPVVQQITPRGVVLEYGGRSYLLAQQ